MSPTTRLLLNALLRLAFLGFALWIGLGGEAALPGAPLATRIGLMLLFLAVSILLGEVAQQRDHLGALLKLLKGMAPGAKRDDREAVDILLQGLASKDPAVREKVHHHLRRLTGQDLPPDPEAWRAWWAVSRETFQAPASAADPRAPTGTA